MELIDQVTFVIDNKLPISTLKKTNEALEHLPLHMMNSYTIRVFEKLKERYQGQGRKFMTENGKLKRPSQDSENTSDSNIIKKNRPDISKKQR